jgi:hypothetical protein
MNINQAILAATCAGLNVSNVSKQRDGKKSFTVGNLIVAHRNDGGRAMWRVNGQLVGYQGEAIAYAVAAQTTVVKS